MAKVRELFTVWGFEVDMKPLERLDQAIETTKSSLKSIALTAAAAGGSLFGIVKFTADAGQEALLMAQKVGVGVEALQELQFAAKMTHVEAEALQKGLEDVSKRAFAASRGSAEANQAFALLGIKLRNGNGALKTSDQLLADIADRFQKLPDGPKKIALAADLLGKSGANLIPLLNKGSAGIAALRKEAIELGAVMSQEDAKAAEEFNMNLSRLYTVITGIRNLVGNSLIPVFNDVVVEVRKLILANRELIAENVKVFASVLISLFKQLLTIMTQTVRIVRNLTMVFGGAANAAKLLAFAISTFLGLKLAYGVGQSVIALAGLVKMFMTAGNAALIAQAKMLLIPLAITAIIAALALVAEDFVTFSQGGNSVIGLIIKAIDEMFDHIEERSKGLAIFLKVIFSALLFPVRLIVNAFGLISDAIQTIMGDKGLGEFFKGALGRVGNVLAGNVFGGGAEALFGLNPPPLPSAAIPAPSPANLAGRQVTVSQQASVDVNVLGLPPEQAASVARDSMTEAFENILRQTGREAEPAVER